MVCLGSSLNIMLNIEEHTGMAYVVISCIAESPKTPLGLSSTTLGIFLYRRRGHRHPSHPCHKNEKKAGLTKQHEECRERGISWCDVRVCFRSSLRVLEYHGISTNIVQYQSVGRSPHILEYHGVSNNLVESYGIPWYHGLSVLEAYWPYWNIMEYRGAS